MYLQKLAGSFVKSLLRVLSMETMYGVDKGTYCFKTALLYY